VLGSVCNDDFTVRILVQGSTVCCDVGEAARDMPGENSRHVCTHEDNRPVTVHVHRGWQAGNDELGARVEERCLRLQGQHPPRPVATSVSSADLAAPKAAGQDNKPAPLEVEEADSYGRQAGKVDECTEDSDWQTVSEAKLLTRKGATELRRFQLGVCGQDGRVMLTPGPYTLVFGSAGLRSAHVAVTAVPQKPTKK
jgi:hypothetical protein